MKTTVTIEIPTRAIVPSPDNARRDPKAEPEWKSFVQNIAEMGVLQPLVVRPHPKNGKSYELIIGERRLLAAQQAKIKTVPCKVLEADDATAQKMRTAENLHRKDLTPLEEGEQIARLIERTGESCAELAQALGRSAQWIARRASLNNLAPCWKDAVRKNQQGIGSFSAVILEKISRFPAEQQAWLLAEILDRNFEIGYDSIDNLIADFIHILALAPWKPEDTDYGPACASCPKRSGANPDLFDPIKKEDLPWGDRGKKLAHDDRCLDRACYNAKMDAWLLAAHKAAADKHENLKYGSEQYRISSEESDGTPWEGKPIVGNATYMRKTTKKKGGVPHFMIDGPNRGQVMYLEPERKSSGSTAVGPKQKKSLAEKKEQLEKLRNRIITDAVRERLRVEARFRNAETSKTYETPKPYGTSDEAVRIRMDLTYPTRKQALALVAAFGTRIENTQTGDGSLARFFKLLEQHEESIVDLVCAQVFDLLCERLKWYDAPDMREVEYFAKLLGIDLDPLRKRAEQKKPTPKSWATLEAAEKVKKSKKKGK